MNDVARKFSQTEGDPAGEIKKRAENDEESAEKEKNAAEIAQRVHDGSLENLGREVKELKEAGSKGNEKSCRCMMRPI